MRRKWCILNVRSMKKAIYGFAALGQACRGVFDGLSRYIEGGRLDVADNCILSRPVNGYDGKACHLCPAEGGRGFPRSDLSVALLPPLLGHGIALWPAW